MVWRDLVQLALVLAEGGRGRAQRCLGVLQLGIHARVLLLQSRQRGLHFAVALVLLVLHAVKRCRCGRAARLLVQRLDLGVHAIRLGRQGLDALQQRGTLS